MSVPTIRTEEEMLEFLTKHGWSEIHAENNWVKNSWYNDGIHNVNYCGISLIEAYKKCWYEVDDV